MAPPKKSPRKRAGMTPEQRKADRVATTARNRQVADDAKRSTFQTKNALTNRLLRAVDLPGDDAPTPKRNEFTEALQAKILECRRAGVKIRDLVEIPGFPSLETLYQWFADYPAFEKAFDDAGAGFMRVLVEDTVDIADDGRNDSFIDDDGRLVINHEIVARSRLRVDTIRWLASKMAPKRYGEKIVQEHTGADGAPLNPETPSILTTEVLAKLSDKELAVLRKVMDLQKKGAEGAR